MATMRSAWKWYDLSPNIAVANQDKITVAPMVEAGTIKEVWLGINTQLTTGGGIVSLANGSLNVLSATNHTLGSAASAYPTAGVAASKTLSTVAQNLRVAAGDMLKATWTMTTVATTNGVTLFVAVEPDLY